MILSLLSSLFNLGRELFSYLGLTRLMNAGRAEAANEINQQALDDAQAAAEIDAAPDVGDLPTLVERLRDERGREEPGVGEGNPT